MCPSVSLKDDFSLSTFICFILILGFPDGSVVENLPANAGDLGLIPGSQRSPGEGHWQPTPVFLPGKAHGQRSLAATANGVAKELDIT